MTLREFVQLFVIHTNISDYSSNAEMISAAIYCWHAINYACDEEGTDEEGIEQK